MPHKVKTEWFSEMTALQEQIAAAHSASMVGSVRRALIEGEGEGYLEARLSENIVVRVEGEKSLIGKFAEVEITGARSWVLTGRVKNVL